MTLAERIEKFDSLVGDIVPSYVKKDLLDKGFFVAPASTKYHGNYEGGLFDHSCSRRPYREEWSQVGKFQ